MTDTVLVVVIGALLVLTWRQRRHLRHLKRHPAPHGIDTWDLPCRSCRRPVRASRVYACLEHLPHGPGVPHLARIRVWHADRPCCVADYLTDPDVMEHQLRGDGS